MDAIQFPCAWRQRAAAAPVANGRADDAPTRRTAFTRQRRLALQAATSALGIASLWPGAAQVGAAIEPYVQRDAARQRYRAIAARHVYDTYHQRIYKGKLPPLLYAIAITETEVDENGNVVSAVVIREPAAAKEVAPWVVSLIHAASPFPKPAPAGRTRFLEIWLDDESGAFQLDTLTEGQN